MRRIPFFLLAGILTLSTLSCGKESGQVGANSRISISGAWALYPMLVTWAGEYRKANPGITIDISAGGAGKGMADALSGVVDLGMVSRDISRSEVDKGAWWVAVVRDAVVPTMNASNPHLTKIMKRGLARDELEGFWIRGAIKQWNTLTGDPGSDPVHVYTRSDACGAAETWAKFLKGTQEDLKGVGVYGDPGLAEAVRNDRMAVGYNNINFAYDSRSGKPIPGIVVLPIDINGNGRVDDNENFYATRDDITAAIAGGSYPSPPARDLNLVSNGRPSKKQVLDFLVWILTDGQRFVDEAGYIRLTENKISEQRTRVSR